MAAIKVTDLPGDMAWQTVVTLADEKYCQEAIARATPGCPVALELDCEIDELTYDPVWHCDVFLPDGSVLGRLGPRNRVTQALDEGQIALQANVHSISERDGWATARILVSIGPSKQPSTKEEIAGEQSLRPIGVLDLRGGRKATVSSFVSPARTRSDR